MVQSGSTTGTSDKDEEMPMYMQSTPSGYRFRRGVPARLRDILEQTEIIVPLGKNYALARRRANEEAVRSDKLFEEAKAKLAKRGAFAGNFYDSLTPITELTEELKQQLQSYWIAVVDAADQERRAAQKPPESAAEREEFRQDATETMAMLKTAWRDGEVDPFLPALHTTLMTRGYRLEMSMEDQRRLCLQYLRAALAGYKLLEARDLGEDPPLNLSASPLPASGPALAAKAQTSTASSSSGECDTLYSLFEYWRDSGVIREDKTVDDVETRIRELEALTLGKSASQLVKADFILYRDTRSKCVAQTTVDKDLSFLKSVMQYAFESDKLPSNPASGVKVPLDQMPSPQRDLEIDDLQKLFSSAIYTEGERPKGGSQDAAAWLPLMALYTGARLEELCQLTLDDIKTEAPIPYIRIIDLLNVKQDKQVKRLKNEGSRRDIPIPQKLFAHGFLAYVQHLREQKESWLFPHLTVEKKYGRRGANWSKWWGRWRHGLDVAGRERCFHAFRHVFKSTCRAVGIGEDIHDAFTGHARGHEGRKYGKFPLQALHRPIDQVAYPELTFDWVWQPTVEVTQKKRAPSRRTPTRVRPAPTVRGQVTAVKDGKQQKQDTATSPETKIYFDTKFSNLTDGSKLISLGAVASSGEEFYAELAPLPDNCSAFVVETVLPMLSGPKLSRSQFIEQLAAWLTQYKNPVLLSDSSWDIFALRGLVEGYADHRRGGLVLPGHTEPLASLMTLSPLVEPLQSVFDAALSQHFAQSGRQHHALEDARALRAGVLACDAVSR